jgi:SAM-dependent methyltransferase
LPFADGAFDTVVAAWMLYHVPDIEAGLGEIARVLTKGGALVAVTNSVEHIVELRELLAYPPGAFEMTFNSENGEEQLRRHFAVVEHIDTVVKATVREREKLLAYRNSVSVPAAEVPDDVELPFVVHGRSTIFVAMK